MTSLPTIQMQGAMVRMGAITAVKDTNDRLLQPGVVLVGGGPPRGRGRGRG